MTRAHTPPGIAADHAGAHPPEATPGSEALRSVIAAEIGEATRAWMRLAGRRYSNGVRGLIMLARCRTPQDMIAARADLLCEDLDLIRAGCRGISDIIAGAASDAVRVIDAKGAA